MLCIWVLQHLTNKFITLMMSLKWHAVDFVRHLELFCQLDEFQWIFSWENIDLIYYHQWFLAKIFSFSFTMFCIKLKGPVQNESTYEMKKKNELAFISVCRNEWSLLSILIWWKIPIWPIISSYLLHKSNSMVLWCSINWVQIELLNDSFANGIHQFDSNGPSNCINSY